MPATKKKKKVAKSEGQRKHKVLRNKCSPEEMEFCAAIAKGLSPGKAGVQVFHFANPDSGYQVLKRPRVQKFLERLLDRGEEKFIEKQAEKLALNLDLADSRLTELLSSPRMDESKMAVLAQLGRTKAGVDLIQASGILTALAAKAAPASQVDPSTALPAPAAAPEANPAPPDIAPEPLPVNDIVLVKAIDLAYKRKGGYGTTQPTATSQAIVQIVQQQQGERVYESRWVREQEKLDGPDCESIEHSLGLGTNAPAGIHTRGAETS